MRKCVVVIVVVVEKAKRDRETICTSNLCIYYLLRTSLYILRERERERERRERERETKVLSFILNSFFTKIWHLLRLDSCLNKCFFSLARLM